MFQCLNVKTGSVFFARLFFVFCFFLIFSTYQCVFFVFISEDILQVP